MICLPLLNINAQTNENIHHFDELLTATSDAENPNQILEAATGNAENPEPLITASIEVISIDSVSILDPIQPLGFIADSSKYTQGMLDASRFYPKKNTGAGGTFCTTFLLSPLFGLVPALLCSAKEPTLSNMGYPNADLIQDSEYLRGYTEQAHKLKKKKVWTAYGAGAGAYLVVLAIVYSQ